MTGSDGEALARRFIISELTRLGAKPLPGLGDFESPFEFTAGTRDGGSTVGLAREPRNGVVGGTVFGAADARALSFSDNGDMRGPLVFAGYGIVVPDSQDFGYDSYATLDVKDKIVLVLRYFPEDADQKTRAILARYSDLRYKAMAARQHGAKAMLVVTGPHSPNAGELTPMTFDTAIAGSGLLAVSVTGKVASDIFESGAPGKTLADTQKSLDSGNPHVAGFALPGVEVSVHAAVVRETRTGRNISGYLPATVSAAAAAQAVGGARRALRPPRERRQRPVAGVEGGVRTRAWRRRRQRVGHGGGARHRRHVFAGAAPPEPRLQLLVG